MQLKTFATQNICNAKHVQLKKSATQNICNSKHLHFKTFATQNIWQLDTFAAETFAAPRKHVETQTNEPKGGHARAPNGSNEDPKGGHAMAPKGAMRGPRRDMPEIKHRHTPRTTVRKFCEIVLKQYRI